MNKKKILSIILFISASFCFSQAEMEDSKLLQKESESIINKDLQDKFIIVTDPHIYEMNPQLSSVSSDNHFLMNLYEGLFTYNPVSLEPEFAIAIDYRISRDKKRWSFTINPQARFSNGDKITAKNVRDSWVELLSNPLAPYASLLDVIKGAREFRLGSGSIEDLGIYANDDETLTIHLVKPANYLPKVLCHVAFSVIPSKELLEQNVASGAYYLKAQGNSLFLLTKNPHYWDKSSCYLENVIIVQSANPDENAHWFNTGYADWVKADTNLEKIINKQAFSLDAMFGTYYFFFKFREGSLWNYHEFRAALFEVIPWDAIREGYYFPAETFVYPLGNYPKVEGFSFTDENQARILMKEARKKYGISEDLQIPLVFEVSQGNVSPETQKVLKESFAKIGVDFIIKEIPISLYYNNIKSSSSDMFVYSWIGDFADPLAFLELYRSDSSLNESGWKNKEFDRLLDEASVVSDEERYKILAKAENLLLDDYMIIPIQHPLAFNIINKQEVGGWVSNPTDVHLFKYLYKKNPIKKRSDVVRFDR